MFSRTSLWGAGVVALGVVLASGSGCGSNAERSDGGAGPQPGPRDPVSAAIVGFEGKAWAASAGSTAPAADFIQGTGALEITNPANELDLVSPPVTWEAEAITGLGEASATVSLDVMLPSKLANPHNAGSLQLWITCPSRGVSNAYLGKVDFKDARLGVFRTVKFSVPADVGAALREPGWTDLQFHFRLHSPGRDSTTYVFDNLRARSAATPPPGAGRTIDLVAMLSYDPRVSTPGIASFPVGVVQIPASFHLKLGRAGNGTTTLELGRGGTILHTCTYAASKDGLDYLFQGCTGSALAGDLVTADLAQLTIVSGDPAAGLTKIRAQLAGNPAGDEVGYGIIPPMPTYWGDSAASADKIATDYFASVNKTAPTAERWIIAPVGDFARRLGDGTPFDTTTGPPPPNDPPFSQEGHLNQGGAWDGYWRLDGNLAYDASGGKNTTHFQADLSAHAVVWSRDVEVLKLASQIDTDNGIVSAGGTTAPSSTGKLNAYLFGVRVPGGGDNLANFNHSISKSASINTPPIQIWVFYVTVGVSGEVSLTTSGTLSAGGFDVAVVPHAAVGGHLEGGVNLYLVSGGVAADIQLLSVDVPLTARAGWIISTDPAVCNGSLDYRLKAEANIGALGGHVDLVATFGVCPICDHESWTIYSWDPLPIASKPLFQFAGNQEIFPLPASACVVPLEAAILNPASGAQVTTGINTILQGSVIRPATAGAVARPVACSAWTWTSSDPTDVGFPATGCSPTVTFNALGARTITLRAQDAYGEVGQATQTFTVSQCPGSTPSNYGASCGGCGGQITCDGSCSIATPAGLGGACGAGGCGVMTCGGCDNATPNAGTACGCAGGTIQCGGACSTPQDPNEGNSCGTCGGETLCDGSCSGPQSCYVVGTIYPGDGYWGDWSGMARCPFGAYAKGYALRAEPSIGGGDDTALNAIQVYCEWWYGAPSEPLTPHPGFWGDWLARADCPAGAYMDGIQMKIEPPLGGGKDDTAANRVLAHCSDGTTIEAGHYTDWGNWGAWNYCPAGSAICGVMTRVEGKQGGGSGDDDTALNGLRFDCCAK
jgi:hypothetical protein